MIGMPKRPEKDQFSGALIGQCLGDALGCPVEGWDPATCTQYVEGVLRTGRAGQTPFRIGQYTDDSQLARELLQSFVDRKRFEPEDYAQRIVAIFADERIVRPGRATWAAAQRLMQGVPWQNAGTP